MILVTNMSILMTVGNKKIVARMITCKLMKNSQMDSLTLESISIRKAFILDSPHQQVIKLVVEMPVHLAMKLLMLKILFHGAFTT
jgi:hypothetical protein